MTAVAHPLDTTTPDARVVTLTPDMAERLLAANPRNRSYSAKNYATIKRAVERDEWRLNGEAIKVATNGYLLDGQHRCRAVVETGVPIETFLITGVPVDAQDTMDTGKSRTLADILKIQGEANTTALAALIRKVYTHERAGLSEAASRNAHPFTVHEQLQWFNANRWVCDYVNPAAVIASRTPLTASVVGLFMRAFDEIDSEDSRFFWERLADGVGLSGQHPIYVLRRALQNLADDTRGQRNQRYMAALVIKAWNAYRAGEEISLLRYRVGGARPEPFPEPK